MHNVGLPFILCNYACKIMYKEEGVGLGNYVHGRGSRPWNEALNEHVHSAPLSYFSSMLSMNVQEDEEVSFFI